MLTMNQIKTVINTKYTVTDDSVVVTVREMAY